jgi:hypothetical protein
MLKRALGSICLSGFMAFITVRVLGLPDFSSAIAFLSGSGITASNSLATIDLIIWFIVGCILIFNIINTLRKVSGQWEIRLKRRQQAWGMMAIGILVLTIGLVRHYGPGDSICCGNINEARQVNIGK